MTTLGLLMSNLFATVLVLGWALLFLSPIALLITIGAEFKQDFAFSSHKSPHVRTHSVLNNAANVDFTHTEDASAPFGKAPKRPAAQDEIHV